MIEIKLTKKVDKCQLIYELTEALPDLDQKKIRLIEGSGHDLILKIYEDVDIEKVNRVIADHTPLCTLSEEHRGVQTKIFKESEMAETTDKAQAFDSMASVLGAVLTPVIVAETRKEIAPALARIEQVVSELKSDSIAKNDKLDKAIVALSTEVGRVNETLAKQSELTAKKVSEALKTLTFETKVKA